MKFEKQVFEKRTLLLDGNEFFGCTFKNCHIQFAGIMGCTLGNNHFHDCTWGFVGPAAKTLEFMAGVYAGVGGDMQKMIEATFENIRKGINPIPPGTVKH